MGDIRIERLEKLKDALIATNLSETNLDNFLETYDSMLYKTFSGEFDDVFLSDNLTGLNEEKRNEILALSRKYNSLCFYLGEFDNWLDSIEGVTLSDLDLTAMKLLDNYDYLIRLAKNGGEEVLRFLSKFQGSDLFKRGAIIASLRTSFYNDDTLEKVLIEMVKEDGNYKDFSDKQKLVLCNYPEGVLYKVNEDKSIDFIPGSELKRLVTKAYIGSDEEYDLNNIDITSFEEIIGSIYTSYYEN